MSVPGPGRGHGRDRVRNEHLARPRPGAGCRHGAGRATGRSPHGRSWARRAERRGSSARGSARRSCAIPPTRRRSGRGGHAEVKPVVVVTPDPAGAAAERLAAAGQRGWARRAAGGSTPRAAYERAAEMDADWSAATLWFGDERCVPPDHEHSNYRMVESALLDRIAGDPPAVKRIQGELGPEAGADAYEEELRATFGDEVPRLDLVLLGLGPDAHTASLFPGDDALGERERLAVGVRDAGHGSPGVPRHHYAPCCERGSRGGLPRVRRGQGRGRRARLLGRPGPVGARPASCSRTTARSTCSPTPGRPRCWRRPR